MDWGDLGRVNSCWFCWFRPFPAVAAVNAATASDSGGQPEESGNLCKDWGIHEWGKIDVNNHRTPVDYAVTQLLKAIQLVTRMHHGLKED
jgi:hypothetical protein